MASIEEKYKSVELKEHILKRPDTYIDSIEKKESEEYIIKRDGSSISIKKENIELIPGLINIIEEIIVNGYDNFSRINQLNKTIKQQNKGKKKGDKLSSKKIVKTIKINITDTGEISVYNDGEGIDVAIHPKEKIYVPEMIFGKLLTSGNYNDKEEKITGGKNGYGAKLTNIYSDYFIVETVDYERKLKYIQKFSKNLSVIDKPSIEKYTKEPYTKITFLPDYKRFKIDNLSSDIISLFEKRAYDLVACSNGELNVYFNDKKVEIKDFNDYISLYIGEQERIINICNERWKIAVCLNKDVKFNQISFVNGINTGKGGRHVEYITSQFTKHIKSILFKKKKVEVKEPTIKSNIMCFAISTIVNPSFDSQTKDILTTVPSKFGSKCEIDIKLAEALGELGVFEKSLKLNDFHNNQLLTKISGKKKNKIFDIEKLDDARFAGTKKSNDCVLILTEGDSAKTMAVAGISVIENSRDYYGIYPLKGKLLNTRGEGKEKMIYKNKEINDLMKIIGLDVNKNYETINTLRYGKIMIMTDQDVDGSHIKGLIINFISSKWPSLLGIENYISCLLTPIIKASKGKTIKNFYSIPDFDKWLKKNNNGKGYHIKYYKGLGTSDPKEAKKYFIDDKKINYFVTDDCLKTLDLAFNNKRADDRKVWLSKYELGKNVIDFEKATLSYTDFINKELIEFSMYDCKRSIPIIYDGLKPSQRKILYCAFKRNLIKEIKVSQFAGYVSEHGAYHHGEASLLGAIINMAQSYVGHNNINYFIPKGQFGSRLEGGKDSAQPRYIFTLLDNLMKIVFNPIDNNIIKYTEDDGVKVEPFFYIPIVPMVLINGTEGIGTGWSSGIPQFNPDDVVKNIKCLLNGEDTLEMLPYYRGFKGKITTQNKQNNWLTKGLYAVLDTNTVHITELPIGMWTNKYKAILDEIMLKKDIYLKDYKNNSSESKVDFTLIFNQNMLSDLITEYDSSGITKFEKMFRLTTKISCDNKLTAWNKKNLIKFKNIDDILLEFYKVRLYYYTKRKEYLIKKLENDLLLLNTKVKFIKEVISGKVIVNNKKKLDIFEQLEKRKYNKMLDKELVTFDNKEGNYDFLINLQIYYLTKEKIEELEKLLEKLQMELDELKKKSDKDLWLEDLTIFEKEYKNHIKEFYKYNDFKESDFSKKTTRKKLVIKDPHKKK